MYTIFNDIDEIKVGEGHFKPKGSWGIEAVRVYNIHSAYYLSFYLSHYHTSYRSKHTDRHHKQNLESLTFKTI